LLKIDHFGIFAIYFVLFYVLLAWKSGPAKAGSAGPSPTSRVDLRKIHKGAEIKQWVAEKFFEIK
jgi:hypothetical protein